jgi:hypothetical protein
MKNDLKIGIVLGAGSPCGGIHRGRARGLGLMLPQIKQLLEG